MTTNRTKCSFIVSTFNRPWHLRCLLASLAIQNERDFEVIITDNNIHISVNALNATVINELHDSRFRHVKAAKGNCYESANFGASLAQGEYLCFPSDDNYYIPDFLKRMLKQKTDLIYCDMIHRHQYRTFNVSPRISRIDKGGFLIRRSKFRPFPWKRSIVTADGMLIEELIKHKISHAKAKGVLWVHN